MLNLFFEWIFWISAIFVLFVTFGYPLLLLLGSLFVRRRDEFSEASVNEPPVSIIIAVYNEEEVIREKLENSLKLDYPKRKLEIIVASDGSTDSTNDIVRSFEDKGVKLYDYEKLGKTGIQNETVKKITGEIVVFSDANAMYHRDAIRKLVRNFSEENVGCVCGQLIYKKTNGAHGGSAEISYWGYEKFLKSFESRISSLIGVNGSIYAIRKADYIEIDNDLISDLVEPLEIVKSGKRVIYEHNAISEEASSSSMEEEFRRKVRILTRSIQGILHMKGLLNPMRYGIFAIQLLVHKMFRYLIPVFLITGALSLLFLIHNTFYFSLFCFAVILLLCAALAKFFRDSLGKIKIFKLLYYYFMVNYALAIAWFNVITGRKIIHWSTKRS